MHWLLLVQDMVAKAKDLHPKVGPVSRYMWARISAALLLEPHLVHLECDRHTVDHNQSALMRDNTAAGVYKSVHMCQL